MHDRKTTTVTIPVYTTLKECDQNVFVYTQQKGEVSVITKTH